MRFLAFILFCNVLLIESGEILKDHKDIVWKFNDLRRELAKYGNITNMHELVVKKHLCQKISEQQGAPGTWPEIYSSYRWTAFEEGDGLESLINITALAVNEKDLLTRTFPDSESWIPEVEHVLPKQKYLCCVNNAYSGAPDLYIFCLLAPEGTLASWNHQRGKAGTECDNGYVNEWGLCRVAKTNEPPATTTTEVPTTSSTITLLETSTAKSTTQQKSITDSNAPSSQNHGDPHAAESPTVTPIPVPSAQTTTMSEMDKKIKKYKDTETDGDEMEVEQFEDYEDSSNVIPIMITVVFVVFRFL